MDTQFERDINNDIEAATSETEGATTESTNEQEVENFVIKFSKPYMFEGKEYTEIDLSSIEEIKGEDLIAIDKQVKRTSGVMVDVLPEVSNNYAIHMAARVTKKPIEFFMNLPAKEIMKLKNLVMGFMF